MIKGDIKIMSDRLLFGQIATVRAVLAVHESMQNLSQREVTEKKRYLQMLEIEKMRRHGRQG